ISGNNAKAVSREQLEAKRTSLTEVESAFRSAEAKCESVLSQITAKEQEMNEQKIKDDLEALFDAGQQTSKKVEQLKNVRNELVSLKELLKKADKESTEWTTRKSEIEQQLFEQKTLFAQESALLERELSSIPEGLRDLKQLQM